MRQRSFAFLFIFFSHHIAAQTMCGTVNEGQTLTLTAPVGNIFTSITFASYGTPNGSCGSFTIGGCHASNSMTIVQAALLGNNSAAIPATNGLFGDPCGGTFKRLYVQAVYAVDLPLKLLSFTGKAYGRVNMLQWETTDEINTLQFDIERSDDAASFFKVGTVMAANSAGNKIYSYMDNVLQAGSHFYRLKMLDQDGRFTYSKTIRLSNVLNGQMQTFPNPVTAVLTIIGLHSGGIIEMLNIQGTVLQKMHVSTQTLQVDMATFPAGIYLLKYRHDEETTIQKIVKQ